MISWRLMRGAIGLNQNVSNIPKNSLFTDNSACQASSFSLPKTSDHTFDVEVPPKPKRPITPWLSFLRENREDFQKRNGPMTASQLTAALSKEWRVIDKTRYEQDFRLKQEEYHRAKSAYENSLTDEHRSVLQHQKSLQIESKDIKKLRRTKPPTLPRSPVNLFCSERFKDPDVKERMRTHRSAQILKELNQEYKNLSESAKERYVELQQEDRLRFQREFNQWYDSVRSDKSLSKGVIDKADSLRKRFTALNYI